MKIWRRVNLSISLQNRTDGIAGRTYVRGGMEPVGAILHIGAEKIAVHFMHSAYVQLRLNFSMTYSPHPHVQTTLS